MKKLERQIDLQICDLKLREAEDGQKSRTVVGYAVVFGQRSVNLVPWSSYRELYEVMEPGCITQDLLNRSDVVLTAFHNNQTILGRWRMGKGTLKLALDQRGLRIECTLAETATADELLSAIERGDISGMSFAFTADEDDSENGVSYEKLEERTADGKEIWLRHVKKVTGLYDVTIAGHPAYEQTTIAQREAINAFLEPHIGKDESPEERQQREAAQNGETHDGENGGSQEGGESEEQKREREQREAEERNAKEEQERQEREQEEAAQRFREQRAMRMRYKALRLRDEIF